MPVRPLLFHCSLKAVDTYCRREHGIITRIIPTTPLRTQIAQSYAPNLNGLQPRPFNHISSSQKTLAVSTS